jgi:phosphomannomutase
MNSYTIARASRGLADCLNALYPDARERGVVVGYDCRHNSEKLPPSRPA